MVDLLFILDDERRNYDEELTKLKEPSRLSLMKAKTDGLLSGCHSTVNIIWYAVALPS